MNCQGFIDLELAIKNGDIYKVKTCIKESLAKGYKPEVILQEGLINGMNVVADRFKDKEIFIPDLLLATRAMNAGLIYLSEELPSNFERKKIGRIVIGTVRGDLHDIGKNLVKIFFEIAGFEVIDLGIDVPVEGFINAVRKYKPQIIGMSSALTTTMYGMKEVIRELEYAKLRDMTLVMVGGVPITKSFAHGIGADICDTDGTMAVTEAKEKLKVC